MTRKTLQSKVSASATSLDQPAYSPIIECPLNLDLMQQRWHARQDMPLPQQGLAVLHQLRHRVLAIADALLKLRRDERDRLRLIELQAARQALLREGARLSAMSEDESGGWGVRAGLVK